MQKVTFSFLSFFRVMAVAVFLIVPGVHANAAAPFVIESLDMDFKSEIQAAAEEGKHLALFFHQQGCPYCDKMRARVLPDPKVSAYYEKNFYVIEINMKGSLPVVTPGGEETTEKGYATKIRVRATPVFTFYGQDGKLALRTTGYLDPKRFLKAGQYVVDGAYKDGTSFFRYLQKGK